jgi:hypothetical protein
MYTFWGDERVHRLVASFHEAGKATTMNERAQEPKPEARRGPRGKKGKADGEAEVLATIAAMPASDRAMAERLHPLIKDSVPELSPKTW